MLSSMVESTTSAERMSLSLFLNVGRRGRGASEEAEGGGVRPLFPSCLGGRLG